MSYLDWKVGDRVVCVESLYGHPARAKWGASVPAPPGVYTIRDIFADPRDLFSDRVFIRLVEVVNKPVDCRLGQFEAAFAARFFRKVQPRKTDISIFTAMLHGKPAKRGVPA